ncbi:50S ribosomal protein L19 [Candidatus Dojkabacteria bacterium]|uniref:Large ribosomal subunit protein bL19 n=1 Tax=Candidatus Dojkabacteria bacterium TaxID=2099670 RepID=A0A955L7N3_9BACT|nr:50S ribosomal protein L19 [Candidatus Dojkabacteria bacterium]
MNIALAKTVETPYMKKTLPNVEVGDMINVTSVIRDEEGEKRRTQDYKGIVLAIKNTGTSKTITVRKISGGVGVEKIFPLHSPNVESITILKKGKVRRSKIYYMRDRIGKSAMKVTDSGAEIKEVQVIDEAYLEASEVEVPEETTVAKEEVVEEVAVEKTETKEEAVEETPTTEKKEDSEEK